MFTQSNITYLKLSNVLISIPTITHIEPIDENSSEIHLMSGRSIVVKVSPLEIHKLILGK